MTIDYTALAERIAAHAAMHEEIAGDGTNGYSQEQRTFAADLRTVVTMLNEAAEAKPALWMQSNHVSWAGKQPFMARCAPTQLHPDFVALYLHPALRLTAMDAEAWAELHRLRAERGPADDGHATWKEAAIAERVRRVKAERAELTEAQIEAQIEARDALLDFIGENSTTSEGVQHYLDRYVRAALAAKEKPE